MKFQGSGSHWSGEKKFTRYFFTKFTKITITKKLEVLEQNGLQIRNQRTRFTPVQPFWAKIHLGGRAKWAEGHLGGRPFRRVDTWASDHLGGRTLGRNFSGVQRFVELSLKFDDCSVRVPKSDRALCSLPEPPLRHPIWS